MSHAINFAKLKESDVLPLLRLHPDRNLGDAAIKRVAYQLSGYRGSVSNFIKQRREAMLLHSYYYYKCDAPVITDEQWQDLANDLVVLQDSFPDSANIGFYDAAFKDWDGSTGFDLPEDDYVKGEAKRWYRIFTGKNLPKIHWE